MLVGAAGILVELFLAALAMIAWTQLEPGLGRSVAYNVIILCGVSTLFMNGNPLLRYDGYYVLSDAIEIPNLGQRANAWLGICSSATCWAWPPSRRRAPAGASSGGSWAMRCCPSSTACSSCSWPSSWWRGSSFLRRPAGLLGHPEHHCHAAVAAGAAAVHRPADPGAPGRSYAITALCVLAAAGLAGAVPMPSSTDTEGVVWVPPSAQVRAPVAGFVRERQAADDALVAAGAPLLALENDELQRRDAMLAAQVDEYQARYVQAHAQNPVQAAITRHQWQSLLTEKRAVDEQVQSQQVRSRHAGRYVSAQPEDMTGRYVQRGELLGYVLTEAETVRVVVPQSSLERIHRSLEGVRVRLVQDAGREFEARVLREVPSATDELPSMALSLQGGGSIGVDPRKSQEGRAKSAENLFVMDLQLPPDAPRGYVGARVYVKFSHEPRPIALQAYDMVRQMVLRQLKL